MSKLIAAENSRTRGDGMEQHELSTQDALTTQSSASTKQIISPNIYKTHQRQPSVPGEKLIYKPKNFDTSTSLAAVIPKGKIFNLIPHLIRREKPPSLNKKEPKFIPFEPYKAAVNPIIPYKKTSRNLQKIKIDKNNLDLNVLISQMSEIKTTELGIVQCQQASKILLDNDVEKIRMQREIDELKKEREYYSNELKFQSKVNSELKKLLVAAVGEDIQTKVNVLTEDKLQLARALLDSAQHLSSHTEQIEFLAGQSEVWRSKFLASSLMVEELARWKASLTQRSDILFASTKNLLDTCSHVREMLIELLKNLKFITNMHSINLPSTNILDVAAELLNISQQMVLHSGIGIPDSINMTGLDPLTSAEKLAIEGLQRTHQQGLMPMDEAFKAIFGKAFPSSKKSLKSGNEVENEKSWMTES